MELNERTIIIGGGLSGLTLAYLLSKKNIATTILEASSRLGGRIHTVKGLAGTPLELGANWFSDMHTHLLSLIDELGLEKYPQYTNGITLFQTKSFEPPQKFYVPESESPSYRLTGGTQMLIEALRQKLPDNSIHLNTKVTGIRKADSGLILETNDSYTHIADRVMICVPPQLVLS